MISRSQFKRQRHFKLDDHLYSIVFDAAPGENAPLVSDTLKPIRYAIERALDDLRRYYKNEHPQDKDFFRLLVISVLHPSILNGINSGTFCLSTKSYLISYYVLQSLFHFLLSNNTLRVNSAFKIQIKVFCLPKSYSKAAEHYRKLEERKKKMKHFLIGAKGGANKGNARKSWCIHVPDRIGDLILENQCLFISLVVAYQHLLALEGSSKAGEFIQQFKKCDSKCCAILKNLLKDFKLYT